MAKPSRAGQPSRQTRARAGARPAAATKAAVGIAPTTTTGVSVEGLLWTALAGLALALRFASLDQLPFSTAESARAFSAWLVSQGNVPDGWPGDITAALTAHLFRIFGSSESVARVIPAVSGSALVLSFWYARRYVGQGSALLAGALIAFSPLAVFTSRSALGFALGGLLSMAMVLALLTYLERLRPLPIIILSASVGLALSSDPIATSTAIAIAAFVAVESAWRRGGTVSQAITTLRSTRDHWRPAAAALVVALFLGFVHFGTDIDRLSLSGIHQWLDMFSLPRDGLPWDYQLQLLFGYEWPLFVAGAMGYGVLVYRWFSASTTLSLTQRLLLVWTTVSLIVVAFATQRESGQILLLLLPLSLLAATLIEAVVSDLDWSVLRRWWPAVALSLGLTAYALVQLSRWARPGGGIDGSEKASLVVALIAAAVLVGAGFRYLQRNGLALALPIAAALALPFLIHSSISVGLINGTEFAAEPRFTPRIDQFALAVNQEAGQQRSPVGVDPRLRDSLGWPLRRSPVVFGEPPAGSVLITEVGREPSSGFETLSGPWTVAQRWVPRDFDLLGAWRWLAYRQPYGNLSNTDVQILVPTQ